MDSATLTQGILLQQHKDAGMTLSEEEDFVYLRRGQEVLAVFSTKGATVASIRHKADQYLERLWSGVEFGYGK